MNRFRLLVFLFAVSLAGNALAVRDYTLRLRDMKIYLQAELAGDGITPTGITATVIGCAPHNTDAKTKAHCGEVSYPVPPNSDTSVPAACRRPAVIQFAQCAQAEWAKQSNNDTSTQ